MTPALGGDYYYPRFTEKEAEVQGSNHSSEVTELERAGASMQRMETEPQHGPPGFGEGMMSAWSVDREVNTFSGKCKETWRKRLRPGTSPDTQARKKGPRTPSLQSQNKGVEEEERTVKVNCCYDLSWNLGLECVFLLLPRDTAAASVQRSRQAGPGPASGPPPRRCPSGFPGPVPCTRAFPPTQGPGQAC